MQSEEWIKIKQVFNQTLDLPRNERDIFLTKQGASVQIEVRELIKSHESSDEFIAEPAVVEFGLNRDLNIGQQIADYKIVSEIGVGGMGAVYLAERTSFEQKVAIKLIKRGMDTRQVLKRFKLERQILSRLSHPNIAKLVDGGETPDGLPYFVMEYIEGETIIEFCENHEFNVEERLDIFEKVCRAISYAHAKLIVHRDIKPSNILVIGDGTPKLLDFGIAKLLDSEIEYTATVGRMFTPEYASPEQINGLPITTATDVYSLGVVLYELLTGVRPFTSKVRNYDEIATLVSTVEPQKPSSVVSSRRLTVRNTGKINDESNGNSNNRRAKYENRKSLVGDLDNIVLKALRKESEMRYQSVADFGEDIKRHLQGLPVSATDDTKRYRFTKFVRRHKKSIAISTLVSLLILSISSIAIYQGIVATRERVRAERRLVETRKMANSLMFEIHDSIQNLPGATASRELLVKSALEYLNSLSGETLDNPELELELATAYRKVGDIQGGHFAKTGKSLDALENYSKAYQIQTKHFKADENNFDILREFGITTSKLAEISYYSTGNVEDALKYFQESKELYERLLIAQSNNAMWKSKLAGIYSSTSDLLAEKGIYNEAEKDRIKSLKFNDDALASDSENSDVMNTAAGIYTKIGNKLGNPDFNDLGKLDESNELLQKALLIRQKLSDKEPLNIRFKSQVGSNYMHLGTIHLEKGDFEHAVKYYQNALEIHQELSEKDPKDIFMQGAVAYDQRKMGVALQKTGKNNQALNYQKTAVAIFKSLYEQDSNNIGLRLTFGLCLAELADTLTANGKFVEALETLKQSLGLLEKSNSIADTFETRSAVASVYLKMGLAKLNIRGDCKSSSEDFTKSCEMFEKAKEKDLLSPSNSEMYLKAQKFTLRTTCE